MCLLIMGDISWATHVTHTTQGSCREREREREIHYVHWASKVYEDESVFMSEAHLGWQ